MKIYGLTGGIGSGKTTVARIFESLGVPFVDADTVARKLRDPGQEAHTQIQKRFGTTDRLALRTLLSNDSDAKKDLESILHPLIKTESDRALQALAKEHPQAPCLLYEASLIIEAGRVKDFDGLIVVTAPQDERLKRVKVRDQLEETAILAMILAQMTDEDRMKQATYVIQNHGSLDDLRAQAQKVLDQINTA